MTEHDPQPTTCENCGKETDELSYYDNEIVGPAGWLCSDCISDAELEL